MNPNIPKPKPGKDNPDARVKIPRQPRPGPLTPRTPGAPGKREKRPLPKPGSRVNSDLRYTIQPRNPIGKPFDLRKEKQLPRKPLNKSGLKKDGPSGKKGSLSMSVKKPLLIRRKKIGAR